MKITINGSEGTFDQPTTVRELIAALAPDALDTALGALSGGTVLELTQVVNEDIDMTTLSLSDEEGRRMYERSLRFVFLLAVKRSFPDAQVRFEHSLGQGIYVRVINHRLSLFEVLTIEEEMRHIIAQDEPFVRKRWSREQAIAYFTQNNSPDKARLLNYRPYSFFDVYEAGGMAEYFYGAMLPSTGHVRVFGLRPRSPGLVLLMPDRDDPSVAAPLMHAPKLMAMMAESSYWCDLFDCMNVADLNDLVSRAKLRDFIRVNEALHDKSMAGIAADIAEMGSRAIFIAGPSSSGKTTFANRLSIHLRVNGLSPVIISMDDFYRDRADVPLEADGMPDLEAISALDVDLLERSLMSLLAGEETMMPRFDFATASRDPVMRPMRITSAQPLIIEGIHGLNPALHVHFDPRLVCRIYISELTNLNLDNHNRIRTTDARLLRRIVRDYKFRKTTPERTLAMWPSVRRGEEKWIFPFQEQADFVFNSALHYELPILKTMSFEILKQVPQDSPYFVMCNRLLKILNYLLPVDMDILDEVPPLSILREFIGGNTFYLYGSTD